MQASAFASRRLGASPRDTISVHGLAADLEVAVPSEQPNPL